MKLDTFVLLCFVRSVYSEVRKLTCGQIKQFVDGHNFRRDMVARGLVPGQPATPFMYTIVWDYELEYRAKRWATHQKFDHDPDTKLESGRFRMGQNLFLFDTSGTTFDIDLPMRYWFGQRRHFKYHTLGLWDFYGANKTLFNFYTQFIWADTVYVGCAINNFYDDYGYNNFLVVCNYGPAGNIIGKPPYEKGRSSTIQCHRYLKYLGDCDYWYGRYCPKANLTELWYTSTPRST